MKNSGIDRQHAPQGGRSQAQGESNRKTFAEAGTKAIRDAVDDASRSATGAASTIGHHVKSLLDDQVGHGAAIVAQFASATKKAADELDTGSPQAARFVRGVADRLDDYAGALRDQSVEELAQAAADYTRRQPALVFGLAAIAGFLALRTFKNASVRPLHASGTGYPMAPGQGRSNVSRQGQSNVSRQGQSNVSRQGQSNV